MREPKRPKVLSAVTTVIALAPGAIDEELLGEADSHLRGEKDATLDRSRRAEGPTRPAGRLIFYLGNVSDIVKK